MNGFLIMRENDFNLVIRWKLSCFQFQKTKNKLIDIFKAFNTLSLSNLAVGQATIKLKSEMSFASQFDL